MSSLIEFVVVEIGYVVFFLFFFFSFCWKSKRLFGKGAQVESKDNGTQENCSPTWLRVSDFMVMWNFAVYLIEFY